MYKRAQILVADLWACFEGKGYGYFEDIDKITMFAGPVNANKSKVEMLTCTRLPHSPDAPHPLMPHLLASPRLPHPPTQTHRKRSLMGDSATRLQYLVHRTHQARDHASASWSESQCHLD